MIIIYCSKTQQTDAVTPTPLAHRSHSCMRALALGHDTLHTLSAAMYPIENAQLMLINFAGRAVHANGGQGHGGRGGRGGRGGGPASGRGADNPSDSKTPSASLQEQKPGRSGGRGCGLPGKRHCFVCGKLGHIVFHCRQRATPVGQWEAPVDTSHCNNHAMMALHDEHESDFSILGFSSEFSKLHTAA